MGSSTLSIPANQAINVVINQVDPKDSEDEKAPVEQYVDDGKGNHNLPEDLKKALKALLKHYGTTVDKAARHDEVVDARRQRFYDRNYQYIYFNSNQQVFIPVVGGVTMNVGSDSVQMPRYCNVYNIYKPYRRNFSATLSQNPPGVNFEPKKQGDALDMKIAEAAQKYSVHYDTVNDRQKLQAKISRLFWTDGRVVGWTRHEKNGQKFGYVDGAEDGSEQEENGEEITDLYGVLEAKCFPITADSQDELTGVIVSDDPDINRAKDDYEWIAEDIKSGSSGAGETAFERNARIGVLKGLRKWASDGDSQSQLVERQRMFLRPAGFRHVSEERPQLEQIFPEGVRATFVGNEYAEAFPVSLDDEICVDHALDGDGMNRPSWGSSMMPIQDAFNNYRNMRQEYHDYGIPFVGYDVQLLDGNAIREMVSQPGEFKGFTNPTPGSPLENSFFVPKAVSPPADLIQAEQDLRDGLSQLVTAVQPALFGGKMGGDEERVGVYQIAREQAMGVMALPWGVMQAMFARFKYQAVLAAGKNRREEQVLQVKPPAKKFGGSSKPLSVSIADLKKGNFRAVPDTDSSFPATRAMKSQAFDKFMSAAEFNPLLAEAAQQPDNLELGAELLGLTDLDIPAARAWRRQLEEIDTLLGTGPVPPTQEQVNAAQLAATTMVAMQAAAQGQKAGPLPPEAQGPTPEQWSDPNFINSGDWLDNKLMLSLAKSTVEVDAEDFHQYHKLTIKDWFNSDARDKEMDKGNRKGLANIKLHLAEHNKFVPDPPQGMPPMPMMPPPGAKKPPQGAAAGAA